MKLFNKLPEAYTAELDEKHFFAKLVRTLESDEIQHTDEDGSLPATFVLEDEWYDSGDTKWVPRAWFDEIRRWCEEPTHFHMTLEDYLAALLGVVAGEKTFFELLPCEMQKRPEREFTEFFEMARGAKNGNGD